MDQIALPLDPDQETRLHNSFARQPIMLLLNARIVKASLGEVQIEFPFNSSFTQQNGYMHAGILTTVVDTACGCAAFTHMSPNREVLSIEFKVNFLSPAIGEKFVSFGKVIKAGRNISVCSGEVWAFQSGTEKLVAVMQASMMTVEKRYD